MADEYELGVTCDMHVHVREGAMCELVTPKIRDGGISVAYIMPNLQPPITTIERVRSYKHTLQNLAPKTTFLMSFYLSRDLTTELVRKAARLGVVQGIKCYPAGVTTNSAAGVDPNNFSEFYPIFEVMEQEGLVLNLHGEKPSVSNAINEEIHVMNAEECFLPALREIHQAFPNLKIVLEHCTTEAAVKLIYDINKNTKSAEDVKVAATLTAHHLFLTVDDWAGNPINFCKPVAKLPKDRRALIQAATSGEPFFFFGSDSAPHPLHAKATHMGVCAGVYTQSYALAYLAEIFDAVDALDKLQGFVSLYPQQFYNVDKHSLSSQDKAVLIKNEQRVADMVSDNTGAVKVAPFLPGKKLKWSIEWRESNV